MDKSTKYYVKALEKYQNGSIEKALDLCEKSISLNLKNSSSLNLKGLLLYFKVILMRLKGFGNLIKI